MIEKAHIDRMLARLPALEAEMSSPAMVSNPKRMKELVREHSALKKLAELSGRHFTFRKNLAEHKELMESQDADPDLKELAKSEIAELETAIQTSEVDLMFALLPPDPDQNRNVVMEIRAGTGGMEAALFAGDLFRMYSHYAAEKGWKVGLVDGSSSEMGGYKEIIFTVEGTEAYGLLRYESGVHRVQRVPETEAQGRIHTSTATVAVLPEAEEEDEIDIQPEDIRLDLFCASGPGGQKVNKTESAVRITHLATGLVVQSQDERSQHRNKEKAMAVLRSRLLDLKRRQDAEKMGNERRSQIGTGDRSERIRTYNFPQNRLTDHRINLTLYNLNVIIEGKIDEVVAALKNHDIQLRLQQQVN
jgi:peptide chain release factor 1